MLGFKRLPNEVVKAVDPQLDIINKKLKAYYDAWDKFVQSWIIIKIKDPSCVFRWWLKAEVAMRAEGKPGMSDEEDMGFSLFD
ncbi:D-glycerate 3-kinase, chloroplastic-like [Magnolia sinica]|uniref:D-glycerate 3-kinase, chloroplastic-like n=1 Tax=Magnolia sinica TaxID=86752 RepID=UPI00265960E1|nr:D-glycerate 3-kinase, chloroplastic-like [Magnolia sinica]